MRQAFDSQTTDGNSTAVEHHGGETLFAISGTLDGATIHLEMSPDGGTTWIDVRSGSFTTEGASAVHVPARCQLRAAMSGAGAATSVNVWLGRG